LKGQLMGLGSTPQPNGPYPRAHDKACKEHEHKAIIGHEAHSGIQNPKHPPSN
jgi:hypothetical protein